MDKERLQLLVNSLKTRDDNAVHDFNWDPNNHIIETRLELVAGRANDTLMGLVALIELLLEDQEDGQEN